MTIPHRCRFSSLALMLTIAAGLVAHARVAGQGSPLPKEVAALMPASAKNVSGQFLVREPIVRGDISGEVPGQKSCDANPPVVTVRLEINGVVGGQAEVLLPMRQRGWAAEWDRGRSSIGPNPITEQAAGGEVVRAQTERGCIQSPVPSILESAVAAHVDKGPLSYTIRINGPQSADAGRALALEMMANIAKASLPLGAK